MFYKKEIIIVVILEFHLFYYLHFKNDDSVEHKALFYKKSKVKRLISIKEMEQAKKEYSHGIIV